MGSKGQDLGKDSAMASLRGAGIYCVLNPALSYATTSSTDIQASYREYSLLIELKSGKDNAMPFGSPDKKAHGWTMAQIEWASDRMYNHHNLCFLGVTYFIKTELEIVERFFIVPFHIAYATLAGIAQYQYTLPCVLNKGHKYDLRNNNLCAEAQWGEYECKLIGKSKGNKIWEVLPVIDLGVSKLLLARQSNPSLILAPKT